MAEVKREGNLANNALLKVKARHESALAALRRKASALGIDKCGIIKVEAMLDYAERVRERMGRIPNGEALYGWCLKFADIRQTIPWAKSIIVVALHYGHYKVPAEAKNRYGKSYLFDSRFNADSPEARKISAFEDFLHSLGIKTAFDPHPGIKAMRWAAFKAGLGMIRRNNFFYTEKGSYVTIAAWAADREMELIEPLEKNPLPECPSNCDRCIKACPTQSLNAAYTMNMATCVSRLTNQNDTAVYDDETNRKMGCWIYGCDVCQDVCPMNKNKWQELDDFPGMAALAENLPPEKILAMSYEEIEQKLSKKFFYIKKEALGRWKLNAERAIKNAKD
jgi:epoxyqueuosine reductase